MTGGRLALMMMMMMTLRRLVGEILTGSRLLIAVAAARALRRGRPTVRRARREGAPEGPQRTRGDWAGRVAVRVGGGRVETAYLFGRLKPAGRARIRRGRLNQSRGSLANAAGLMRLREGEREGGCVLVLLESAANRCKSSEEFGVIENLADFCG